MKSGIPLHRLLLGTGGAFLFSTLQPARGETIAAWEATGQVSFGTQGLAVTESAPGVVSGGLVRGPLVSTDGTGPGDVWGGQNWDDEAPGTGLDEGNYIGFSVTRPGGAEWTIQSLTLNYRKSLTGPVSAMLYYRIDGIGDFIETEEIPLDDLAATTTGATVSLTGLDENHGLGGVIAESIEFRLVPYAAPAADGSFLINGPGEGRDLVLTGQVEGGSDVSPPLISGLSPADNATGVTAATTTLLTMTFNENVARGSGQILVKETLTGNTAYTLNVTVLDQVTVSDNQVGLELPAGLMAGTAYHVEIPAGAIVDQAVPANPHAGLAGSSAWNFSTASVIPPPQVVVNKYVNGTPDRVELLVVGTGSPASTVDLRGMILKDFSGDMSTDAGGKYVFAASPVWAAVPAGTLVTVSNVLTSPDPAAADFKLAVGLSDPTLFTPVDGSPPMDLTTTDMVMIKAAGSDPLGSSGGIHALAAGSAGIYFTGYTGAKVHSISSAGTNSGVKVANSSASLSDYMSGTDATGNLPLALSDFGAPNSGTNAAYLSILRGQTPGDGDGAATVVNATLSSPLLGLPMFDSAQSGQSAKLTITPRIQGITLSSIQVTVPPELGTPGLVSLSGPGAAGSSHVIDGQTIHITSASATTSSPLDVTIGGLSTPTTNSASNNGSYPLAVSTSANGGTLTPIASQASVQVIVPISSVRELDSEGSAPDLGAVVAVEGTVTEADFGGGAANFSGYLEDETAGINIFSPSLFLGLVRGNRFAVVGTLTQNNGLTGIIPASSSHIVNRLTVPEAVPTVVSLATLHADPEAFEGRLVKVTNLTLEAGTWGPGATVILKNTLQLTLEVRIQSGSTATSPPPYPANVTGIFGQSDSSSPFNSGYFLMPRDPSDLESSPSDFNNWALETGASGGQGGDPDFDGKDNAFEYAFGQNPTSGMSPAPVVSELDLATGKFTYTRRLRSLTTLNYKIFTSTTLDGWSEDESAMTRVLSTAENVETVEVTLSAPKPLAAPKLFIKVEAQ